MGEETAPTLGYTVSCELIGVDFATTSAADGTGANTVDNGAADACTAGAEGAYDATGYATVVAGVTIAPAGNCSPGT